MIFKLFLGVEFLLRRLALLILVVPLIPEVRHPVPLVPAVHPQGLVCLVIQVQVSPIT